MNQEVLGAARTSTLDISIVVKCIRRGIEGSEKAIYNVSFFHLDMDISSQ